MHSVCVCDHVGDGGPAARIRASGAQEAASSRLEAVQEAVVGATPLLTSLACAAGRVLTPEPDECIMFVMLYACASDLMCTWLLAIVVQRFSGRHRPNRVEGATGVTSYDLTASCAQPACIATYAHGVHPSFRQCLMRWKPWHELQQPSKVISWCGDWSRDVGFRQVPCLYGVPSTRCLTHRTENSQRLRCGNTSHINTESLSEGRDCWS
jgi:hypothetical protein